jgi:deoxyadenosine/deoxycytidine kinase
MESKEFKHIAIAGNIGAGKTSLCTRLGRHFTWDVHYEDADNNPYLSDFYNDMRRWAFNLQIYFLNSRFKQIMQIQDGANTVIQDRTIYEDARIFAPNLHEMGLIENRDFRAYLDLFENMSQLIKPPDLLIYLKASIPTLVEHIQDRGREYEGNISLDYLKKLNKRYDAWIESYDSGNLLIINVDELDFMRNDADFGEVLERVNAHIHGLF